MATTLYLIETRARQEYVCAGCRGRVPRGAKHFRHDPHPYARFRGQQTSHWCYECITNSPSVRDSHQRLWIRPAKLVRAQAATRRQLELQLARVEVVGIGRLLAQRLLQDPLA